MTLHNHDHHLHVHAGSERRLAIAAALTGTFMLAELLGGLVAGSLALLADAGHMLTDFASLALAWYGFRLARRPADWKRTYGYDRFSILIAFVNGLALIAIAAWIVVEACHRLSSPTPVLGGVMFWVAFGGLVVNLAAFRILHADPSNNLNVRAATLHVVGDLLGSVAALVAAVIIITTGWTPIDPLLSLSVAVVIVISAWRVIRDSGHILLEGAPRGADNREISADLLATFPDIIDVHHVHVWSITQERPIVTLHARLGRPRAPEHITAEIKDRLAKRFGIAHATVEVEFSACADASATDSIP